jgi:hypothetical protein
VLLVLIAHGVAVAGVVISQQIVHCLLPEERCLQLHSLQRVRERERERDRDRDRETDRERQRQSERGVT